MSWLKSLNVYGAFVRGEDQLRSSAPRTINSSAIMGEADYLLLPWVMPTFRFEKTNFSDRRNVVLLMPAVSVLVRANVRVLVEGRFYNRLQAGGTGQNRIERGAGPARVCVLAKGSSSQ